MRAAERQRDLVEIGHGAHVDPAVGHGDDDVGAAEAELLQELDAVIGVRHLLADEILAGDADVGATGFQIPRDLGRRHERDFDAIEAHDLAAIAALVAGLAHDEIGSGKELRRLLHEPALGRHGKDELVGCAASMTRHRLPL